MSCNGVRERKREREREREREGIDLHVDVTFMLSRNLSRIFMNNKKKHTTITRQKNLITISRPLEKTFLF